MSITKFYCHDASSPNTGTLPSHNPSTWSGYNTGYATGALTNRDATDSIGSNNPDITSTITANADTSQQGWGHRRFLSRPLAAQTFAAADGNWTFSLATSQDNADHNCNTIGIICPWRPSIGNFVDTVNYYKVVLVGGEPTPTGSVQAYSVTAAWSGTTVIQDGDILVFDVYSTFAQGVAAAYSDTFEYDGTTEGSTTTCATFFQAPAPIALLEAGIQKAGIGVIGRI